MSQQRDANESPDILSLLSTWGNNFTTQTSKTVRFSTPALPARPLTSTTSQFSELRTQDYIRLITIIGAYCLLRPYLMKLGAYFQRKQHEADSRSGEDDAAATGATLTANDLRGRKSQPKIAIPGVDSDSEDDEDKDDWGRVARLRQRKFVRQMLEVHETKLREEAEANSDKDIEEFLVD
ncbi:trafficking pga2 [Neofusicoccum parvum]|uniref:Trafficking pga2 n=1 Tax=Neofusicoccum parvum TaxID=310453 RepID=A0ACB5SQ93_9PEZI|nr:trafficking pga2 [Neofusicoccum parvum]